MMHLTGFVQIPPIVKHMQLRAIRQHPTMDLPLAPAQSITGRLLQATPQGDQTGRLRGILQPRPGGKNDSARPEDKEVSIVEGRYCSDPVLCHDNSCLQYLVLLAFKKRDKGTESGYGEA